MLLKRSGGAIAGTPMAAASFAKSLPIEISKSPLANNKRIYMAIDTDLNVSLQIVNLNRSVINKLLIKRFLLRYYRN